jgi:hypothetical protein
MVRSVVLHANELFAIITVPECSMGSGMMFVELRRTRILTEGNSRFYTQPEVWRVNGGWLLPNVPVWLSPSVPV